jgi:hypothetical protein
MNLQEILNNHPSHLALILGNGINRYNNNDGLSSWDAMLLELWEKHTDDEPKDIPLGISLTEFYDALDLSSKLEFKNLQKEFCDLMAAWDAKAHHRDIVAWAKNHSAPILTTNFDETLADSLGLKMQHTDAVKFTDYYPWGSYFAEQDVKNPATEFAIWHINGVKRYSRSVRLGLSHYMGSVERARALIHKGGGKRLYADKAGQYWNGRDTWLHIIFNNDLLFLGLGLDISEVFLRWLLIERAKYFKEFPALRKNTYYVYAGRDLSLGQTIFLKSVGCEIIKEGSYDALYGDVWQG